LVSAAAKSELNRLILKNFPGSVGSVFSRVAENPGRASRGTTSSGERQAAPGECRRYLRPGVGVTAPTRCQAVGRLQVIVLQRVF